MYRLLDLLISSYIQGREIEKFLTFSSNFPKYWLFFALDETDWWKFSLHVLIEVIHIVIIFSDWSSWSKWVSHHFYFIYLRELIIEKIMNEWLEFEWLQLFVAFFFLRILLKSRLFLPFFWVQIIFKLHQEKWTLIKKIDGQIYKVNVRSIEVKFSKNKLMNL